MQSTGRYIAGAMAALVALSVVACGSRAERHHLDVLGRNARDIGRLLDIYANAHEGVFPDDLRAFDKMDDVLFSLRPDSEDTSWLEREFLYLGPRGVMTQAPELFPGEQERERRLLLLALGAPEDTTRSKFYAVFVRTSEPRIQCSTFQLSLREVIEIMASALTVEAQKSVD